MQPPVMSVEAPVTLFGANYRHVPDSERNALLNISPKGMTIRHPPKPHELDTEITPDAQLFQTIHMGAAVVDADSWRLIVDGMVSNSFSVTLSQLKSFPSSTVTTFHECYGSPLKPPTNPLWRIGNVRWTGVMLSTLLSLAVPSPDAKFVWSEGLEFGKFAHITADRYQKDLPMEKAVKPEVLLAYEMNGEPLTKERGFPVRLVVPGWFGTNSTKWICRLSVQDRRAPSPFTTILYNEVDPRDPEGKKMRPVWIAEVNSMICRPRPGEAVGRGTDLTVWGRAWGGDPVETVEISADDGNTWSAATLKSRNDFEWQGFELPFTVPARKGRCRIMARATDRGGESQPLTGRRNHVHSVEIEVL